MQPPNDTEITIRIEDDETIIELSNPAFVLAVTTDYLSVFLPDDRFININLVDLVGLLTAHADAQEAHERNLTALRTFFSHNAPRSPAAKVLNLFSAPANNGHVQTNGASILLRDDYDTIGYHA